jgi:hypothetical protein
MSSRTCVSRFARLRASWSAARSRARSVRCDASFSRRRERLLCFRADEVSAASESSSRPSCEMTASLFHDDVFRSARLLGCMGRLYSTMQGRLGRWQLGQGRSPPFRVVLAASPPCSSLPLWVLVVCLVLWRTASRYEITFRSAPGRHVSAGLQDDGRTAFAMALGGPAHHHRT